MGTTNLFGSGVNLHPRIGNNFIDANVLDRAEINGDDAVDRILALAEDGAFTLLLPYSFAVKRRAALHHKRQAAAAEG